MQIEVNVHDLINMAKKVYHTLGGGYHEGVYQNAMQVELQHQRLLFESQKVVPIFYRSCFVGSHRLDLVVANKIIVELKVSNKQTDKQLQQLQRYIRDSGYQYQGLLLVFPECDNGQLLHRWIDNCNDLLTSSEMTKSLQSPLQSQSPSPLPLQSPLPLPSPLQSPLQSPSLLLSVTIPTKLISLPKDIEVLVRESGNLIP